MVMGQISIRESRTDDIEAIQAIYATHVAQGLASFEEVPPGVAEMAARRDKILAAGLPWLVAEEDGRPVGYCYAGFYHARSAWRFTLEDSIYVGRALIGRGIGRALLSALITRCEAGPWRQMIAVIGDSDNRSSIGLHRALGFTPAGRLPAVGFKFGRWVDCVLMQRPLGKGSASDPALS